jgi:hypothetical protein
MNNILTKNISIDTLFRNNYDNTVSTDFSFNLPDPIKKVISMRISAMELPNVWPSFSKRNKTNSFKIILYNFIDPLDNKFVAKRDFLIKIPTGNYTSLNFINMINSYLLNVGNGLQYLVCTINEINTQTVFRAYNALFDGPAGGNGLDPYYTGEANPYYSETFYFSVDFSNDDPTVRRYQKAGWMLGFKQEYYTTTYSNTYVAVGSPNQNNLLITFNAYLSSESSYGSSVYPYIYLDIDEFQENNRVDSLYHFIGNESVIDNNIIARISISSSQNTILIDNGSDKIFKKRNYIGPITIEKLHIRLINRFGEAIDLVGNDYSFILEITYLQY